MLNRIILSLFVYAAGLLAPVPAVQAADIKVGFVNVTRLLEQAPQAEAASKKLEQEFAPRDRELVTAQKELRKLEDKLARDGGVMSEAGRRKLERDIRARRREIKRAQDEFREDYNIRRNEEFNELLRLVREATVTLAKQENYDLILLGESIIYASDRVDITGQVLERLKKQFKAEQSEGAR